MRIAALYDIHGNLPALEAVLAEIDSESVDAIVCGGDLLAGPCQADCLGLLREREVRFLAGNSEREVLGSQEGRNPWWRGQLSEADRALVAGWPQRLRFDDILFCHATPRSDEEILTHLTPDADVAEALAGAGAATVVAGHTHAQYERTVNGIRLINAGSVGRPYEGRAGAFWAIVGEDVEPRGTDYDVQNALARMRAANMPGLDEDLLESLIEPMARDEVAAIFERQAGREPTQSSVSVSQKANPANSR